jgi:endonuclease/exonuclease/phosphatase family metal-dependent hydrolase
MSIQPGAAPGAQCHLMRRALPWIAILLALACGSSPAPPPAGNAGSAGASGAAGSGGSATSGAGGSVAGAGAGGTSGGGSGGTTGGSSGSGGALGGSAGSSGSAGSTPGPDLALLTFNIRYGSANDGDDAWPLRKELVYAVLDDQLADSIGMQEAEAFQLEEIDVEFPAYDRVGVGRSDGLEGGEFSPIYFKTERLEVVTSATFWFSDTPEVAGSMGWGANYPRICTWALFEEKASGRKYYHYNVHLDHESETARVNSAKLLMERVSARTEQNTPVVVTGDFNTGESSVPIQYLLGTGSIDDGNNPLPLLDTFREVNPDATEVGTFNGFTGESNGGKIDYIFVSPALGAIAAEIIRDNDAGRYPSDHFPVNALIDGATWQ